MTIGINYNHAAVLSLRNLNSNQQLLALIGDRLSSGIRLRRAADGPADLVAANHLRHERIDTDQGVANAESSVSMMQTADGALGEVSALLGRMRTLVLGAANDGANSPAQLAVLQSEFNNAVGSIDRIASGTTFNGRQLLDGTLSDDELAANALGEYAAVSHDARALPGGIQPGSTLSFGPPSGALQHDRVAATFTGAPPATTPIAATSQAGTPLSAGAGQVTIGGPRGSLTVTLTATTTIGDFVAMVNAQTTATGARASYDAATGALAVESTSFGASGLTVSSTDLTGAAGNVGLLDADTTSAANAYATPATDRTMAMTFVDGAGVTQTVAMVQDGLTGDGLGFRSVGGGPEATAPFTGWTDGAFRVTLRDTSDGSIGSTVAAPTVARSATRVSTSVIQAGGRAADGIRLEIADMRAAALGHGAGLAASGFADLTSLSTALTSGNTSEALRVVDAAIDDVSRSRGAVGALQANRVETAMSSLQATSANLTEADSRLRDTDIALASAEYARVQIMYQAATAMLAQANQIPQSVLQLLQQH